MIYFLCGDMAPMQAMAESRVNNLAVGQAGRQCIFVCVLIYLLHNAMGKSVNVAFPGQNIIRV